LIAIDQNVSDARVLEQRLERPETERLVHDVVHELFLLLGRQQPFFRLTQLADQDAHLSADGVRRERLEVLHVQAIDQLLVDADAELLHVDRTLPKRRLRGRNERLGDRGRRNCRRRRHDVRAVTAQLRWRRRNRSFALCEQTHLQSLSQTSAQTARSRLRH
jgi:hypothetical protein